MIGLAAFATACSLDPVGVATRRPEPVDNLDDTPEAILRVPGGGAVSWQLSSERKLPAPPAGRLVDRLGIDALADKRQSLRLGLAPPGRRRPVLGVHYRLTLDD